MDNSRVTQALLGPLEWQREMAYRQQADLSRQQNMMQGQIPSMYRNMARLIRTTPQAMPGAMERYDYLREGVEGKN